MARSGWGDDEGVVGEGADARVDGRVGPIVRSCVRFEFTDEHVELVVTGDRADLRQFDRVGIRVVCLGGRANGLDLDEMPAKRGFDRTDDVAG